MILGRAIWMSVLVYIASFIIGILFAVVLGAGTEIDSVPTSVWLAGAAASVLLMWGFTLWYFRDRRIVGSPREGFLFGVTAVIVGVLFDLLLFIPVMISGGAGMLLSYWSDWRFLLTVLLVLLTPTLVGALKQTVLALWICHPLQYSRCFVVGSFKRCLMSKYFSAGLRPARLMCGRMWL
jgi:hypothetical protein